VAEDRPSLEAGRGDGATAADAVTGLLGDVHAGPLRDLSGGHGVTAQPELVEVPSRGGAEVGMSADAETAGARSHRCPTRDRQRWLRDAVDVEGRGAVAAQ